MSWSSDYPKRPTRREREPHELIFDLKILLCLSLAGNFTLLIVIAWLMKKA